MVLHWRQHCNRHIAEQLFSYTSYRPDHLYTVYISTELKHHENLRLRQHMKTKMVKCKIETIHSFAEVSSLPWAIIGMLFRHMTRGLKVKIMQI